MSCIIPIAGTAADREAAVAREIEKLKRRVIWSERAGDMAADGRGEKMVMANVCFDKFARQEYQ